MRGLLLIGCLLLPLVASAQPPARRAVLTTAPTPPDDGADRLGNFEIQDLMSRFTASETTNHDARRGLQSALRQNGLRRVGAVRGGPTLYASVIGGRVADWLMGDQRGQVMGPQTLRTPGGAQGETICWKCGAGGDGNIHCWQIDCPVIVAPGGNGDD